MKVLFISLGCDKNLVDSEYMIGFLTSAGYELTDDEMEADIIVVNTCGFILDAQEESIQTIIDMAALKDEGKLKKLIVTGCLAQRYQHEILKEIPEVDIVLGTNSYDKIIEAITKSETEKAITYFEPLNFIPKHNVKRRLSTPGHYAHLKIAEGCNKMCSYCAIPSMRGPFRSIPMEELVEQAKDLAQQGVKELILIAQETTMYGIDLYGKKMLHALLDELNKIPDIVWIRLQYCYPEEIYDDLIEAIVGNEKVCHYLDMPIQHCNDNVLKRMNRRTNKKLLVENIKKLRKRIPDICLRTTLICGFPGETEEEHKELLKFVDTMEFDRLGAFAYSQEEGTKAAEMEDQIDEETKLLRKQEVMELSEAVIFDKNQELIGKEMLAFVEGKVADEPSYVARTYRDTPDVDGYIFINTDEDLNTGDFVRVRVIAAYDYDLIGEIIE